MSKSLSDSNRDTEELIAYQEGRYGSYEYGRYGNPTTRTLEEKIRVLEGADDCLVSSSGMNSATTMLLALVPAGGHIVTTTDCYRRTRQFIQTLLPKMGISATVIDPADLGQLERVLSQHDVSLFFSESPTNPYLRCVDVQRISQLCHAAGALVCIDSTFATPINQRAISLGADIVIHSATKYLAGHNDVLAGKYNGHLCILPPHSTPAWTYFLICTTSFDRCHRFKFSMRSPFHEAKNKCWVMLLQALLDIQSMLW